MTVKKDNRNKFWAWLESEIKKRAFLKDGSFILTGGWKKFIGEQDGFRIYAVNGEWVRNNLSVTFGHAGHGFVHEFIPMDEIWLDIYHYEGCSCRNVRKDRKMSQKFFNSTLIHEKAEFKEIENGKTFWRAHQIALQKEREAGILKDPYAEPN